MPTRSASIAVTALSALLLTSACGSSSAPPTQPSGSASSSTSSSKAPANASGVRTTIYGSVGSKGNPESFDINLSDADGKKITELPAGDYELKVTDNATIHNFRIMGPGVDQKTDVQGTGDATFDITLKKGTYAYECEPHASSMRGSFTVV